MSELYIKATIGGELPLGYIFYAETQEEPYKIGFVKCCGQSVYLLNEYPELQKLLLDNWLEYLPDYSVNPTRTKWN